MSIGDEKYVLLTTFRRDGSGVGTPVWIAPLAGGRVGFTTSTATWKTKRLARDPRATLQACDSRGNVRAGAPVVSGAGEVVTSGPDLELVRGLIRAKYGFAVVLIGVGQRIARRFTKRFGQNDAVVVVTLDVT